MTLSAGCYAGGYLAGLAAFVWMAQRRRLATSGILSLMAIGLIGGLVTANITQWLVAGSAGKTVLGAIAGGYLSVFLFKRYLGIRRPTGDLFAVAMSAGEAVGRWGCFFGGCCYGKPTTVPWAVWQHDAYRHPTQLYLSLANVLILWVLWRYDRKSPPENALFYVQGSLYAVARFIIEFFREHDTATVGISLAQWACIAGFAFFTIQLYRLLHPSSPQTAEALA